MSLRSLLAAAALAWPLAAPAQAPVAPAAPPAAPAAPARPPPVEGRIYAPGPFDSVAVDGVGQVRLVQSDRDEVFVAGDGRAQEGVDVHLSGRQLNIDLPGGWKFWKNGDGAQVEVRVRELRQLLMAGANDVVMPGALVGDQLTVRMAGSGLARFDRLQVGRFDIQISGAGEGRLAGSVDQLRVSVSGKGKIAADQLRAGRADVAISGVANAALWVVDDLGVHISGAGHIDYWGQPTVRKSISGWGSVDSRGQK
jgi:hypothetical protein